MFKIISEGKENQKMKRMRQALLSPITSSNVSSSVSHKIPKLCGATIQEAKLYSPSYCKCNGHHGKSCNDSEQASTLVTEMPFKKPSVHRILSDSRLNF